MKLWNLQLEYLLTALCVNFMAMFLEEMMIDENVLNYKVEVGYMPYNNVFAM